MRYVNVVNLLSTSTLEPSKKFEGFFIEYTGCIKPIIYYVSASKNNLPLDVIANFPFDMSEKDVCELFRIFGDIIECKLVKDAAGESKGFGFVVFSRKGSAKRAMKEMDGYRISGRNIATSSRATALL